MFLKKKKNHSLLHRIPHWFEFEVCERKEESTFAECLFDEFPTSPHYSEGSGYSVLLLLSDNSPLQEFLPDLQLII